MALRESVIWMEKYKNLKPHTRYYVDGTRVPGTTTIINVMSKGYGLMKWYWKMGMKGIDVDKYVDKTAQIGTLAHYMVECELKGETPDLEPFSKEEINAAENALIKFWEWEKDNDLEPLLVEEQLVSDSFRYGGTIDLYADLNGKKSLIDLKTSKAIYDNHFIQLGAYQNLLRENGYEVDQTMILRIGRTDDEGFEVQRKDELEPHFELFKHLREVYDLKKQI